MPWSSAYTPTFRRDHKSLGRQDQQRVNEAISGILNSGNPAALGRPKYGKWKGAYGYDVGRAIRVLYSVDPLERVVVFLRCGPHTIY
ncbi:MAG: type II toxin-antitoxin system RelE/ParE family toxin [Nitrososphaerota archaeon]|nr:type II toxin-antitoxin system RelE/ParE family toxin [Nitrososphaerota archaeon]MDG6972921.1 type II toxin-antitoxin system RelE/ParE family toxin [Nitrososphaerota archaeon]